MTVVVGAVAADGALQRRTTLPSSLSSHGLGSDDLSQDESGNRRTGILLGTGSRDGVEFGSTRGWEVLVLLGTRVRLETAPFPLWDRVGIP